MSYANNRITQTFEALKAQNQSALITFMTAGDTRPELTVPLMHALVGAGVDIIELGVPFSDPMADGPAIQLANERALAHNIGLSDVFGMVREFRKTNQNTPVVLMGYLNPIEVMGYDVFARKAGEAGVDGVITVDMPPEEAKRLTQYLAPANIAPIFLLAPTSTPERIKLVCGQAHGFVYYVSLKGVTGSATLDLESVRAKVGEIKQQTNLPVGVGFGIKDAQTAKAMSEISDAVIVGSAIVNRIQALADKPVEDVVQSVGAFAKELKQSITR